MAETLEDTVARLQNIISEADPNIDISPGSAFNELVVKQAAVLQNPIVNDIDELSQGANIASALNATSQTFNPAIDQVASNFGVYRNTGKKSEGKVKIRLTSDNNVYLKQGQQFVQPVLNLTFELAQNYTASRRPGTGELQIISESGGFYFVVPVIATSAGKEYQLQDRMVLTPSGFTISNYVESFAYGNFSTGLGEESDQEMIARLQEGLSHKTLLNKTSIEAVLQDQYPGFQTLSLVGPNEAEMLRGKNNVFGLSTLGVTDVYVRTAQGLETREIVKTASILEGSTYYVDLGKDDHPGFYKVLSVKPTGLDEYGTLEFTQAYSYTLSDFEKINDVASATQARFTRYQTCRITFERPSIADFTGEVAIVVSLQPGIGEIQDMFLSEDQHIVCADYLVKAMIPCFTTVKIKAKKKNSAQVIDEAGIKKEIHAYINGLEIGAPIEFSELIKICHDYGVASVKLPIDVTGQIYTPSSTVINISGQSQLAVPYAPSSMVSTKTTGFIVDYYTNASGNNLTESISLTIE